MSAERDLRIAEAVRDACAKIARGWGSLGCEASHEIKSTNLNDLICEKCKGTGCVDTGGVHPWGEPIFTDCDCLAAIPPDPVAVQDGWRDVPQRVKDDIAAMLHDAASDATGSDYEAGIRADHAFVDACKMLIAMLANASPAYCRPAPLRSRELGEEVQKISNLTLRDFQTANFFNSGTLSSIFGYKIKNEIFDRQLKERKDKNSVEKQLGKAQQKIKHLEEQLENSEQHVKQFWESTVKGFQLATLYATEADYLSLLVAQELGEEKALEFLAKLRGEYPA